MRKEMEPEKRGTKGEAGRQAVVKNGMWNAAGGWPQEVELGRWKKIRMRNAGRR
jgi:hypothetical protein